LALLWLTHFCLTAHPPSVLGQQIERSEYLRFVPLTYPTLISQTPASARFALFGDAREPGYSDTDPVDGVDDRRGEILTRIAVRFAPVLLQNTTAIPMAFEQFWDGPASFLLHVDAWDVALPTPQRLGTETIDLASLGSAPCPQPGPAVGASPGD
jgi:hypothetical protein